MKIDYEKHTIDVPTLNAKFLKNDKIFTIKLLDLKTIKPYIQSQRYRDGWWLSRYCDK